MRSPAVLLFLTASTFSAYGSLLTGDGTPNIPSITSLNTGEVADDFNLNIQAIVTDVRYWVFASSSSGQTPPAEIQWWIRQDNNGQPGQAVASGAASQTVTQVSAPSFPNLGTSYQADFSIGQVELAPGVYWLGLAQPGDDSDTPVNTFWIHSAQGAAGQISLRSLGGDSWQPAGGSVAGFAFELFGTPADTVVPEPSSMMLFSIGAGLISLALARKRR